MGRRGGPGRTAAGAALERVLERAASTAGATAALLVVEPVGGAPRWWSAQMDARDADALAAHVLDRAETPAHLLLADVDLAEGAFARLAVVHPSGVPVPPHAQDLVESFADHVGAALHVQELLDAGTRQIDRAARLGRLAHELTAAEDEQAVSATAADAMPEITGGRAGTVLRLDPGHGVLSVVAASGHTPEQHAQVMGAEFTTSSLPELVAMLNRREAVVLRLGEVSPPLAALLGASGSELVLAAPLVADDRLLGVVTSGWAEAASVADDLDDLLDRVVAVADLTATALHNLRLVAAVRHQSSHDALTGLANRTLFRSRLDDALRDATGVTGTAVLVCDLDRFTGINEVFGHVAGDELLRQVAARLGAELRGQDLVGRLSADEFAVLLTDVDEHRALSIARRVVESLDAAFRIEGRDLRITVSVGLAVHEGPAGRGERLLAAADQAMRVAKQRGRNQVVLAGAENHDLGVPSLEAELAQAAGRHQLRLFFQPLVDASRPDGGVVGAEALIRWAHPRLGLLAPAAFLPLAEESGLVTELDLWAVDAACLALAALEPSGTPMRMAVNMASATLLDPRLLPTVRTALASRDLDPSRLHVEVVESRALVDLPGVIDAMRELRQLGVRIALDDFGTGYSTLSWLHSLPVDQIKIDRSFVMRLPDDGASIAVVRGVLALARELGIEVVAEGVEDAGQLAALTDAGCDMVQGYLLGRPGPVLVQRIAADLR